MFELQTFLLICCKNTNKQKITLLDCKDEKLWCNTQIKTKFRIPEKTTSPITTSGLHFCCLSRADLFKHCFTLFFLLPFILTYFNIPQKTCSTLHTTTLMPVVLFLFNSVCLFCDCTSSHIVLFLSNRSCKVGVNVQPKEDVWYWRRRFGIAHSTVLWGKCTTILKRNYQDFQP